MLFIEKEREGYQCWGWCDLADSEVILGNIYKSPKIEFYLFVPSDRQTLTCSDAKEISKKLSELNKGLK